MTKAALLLLVLGLAGSSAVTAQHGAQPVTPSVASALRETAAGQPQNRCKSDDPKAVIVCGRSQHRYRIDPNVLAAERAAEALPAKPPITADSAQAACVGPECATGGVIPLVGMALTALRAAELAADGDDWRDAFRTHEDEYQAYQDSQAKQAKGSVSVGVSAGNK
jgi:hypothetical protein